MGNRVGTDWLPRRLTAIGDRWARLLRPLWLVTLALAVISVIGATAYVLHDTYETRPVFARVGLSLEAGEPGGPTVGPVGDEAAKLGIEEGSRIRAIDGQALPPDTGVESLTGRLRNAPGPVVTLEIASPAGQAKQYRLTRSPIHARQADRGEWMGRDARFAVRLFSSLLACAVLLLCAVLLFLRRPRDPVAMLLSFGFLLLAATIDPPLTA